jgi:hypothetical protein
MTQRKTLQTIVYELVLILFAVKSINKSVLVTLIAVILDCLKTRVANQRTACVYKYHAHECILGIVSCSGIWSVF